MSVEKMMRPANRLGLDYRAEAQRMVRPPVPIVDAHTHVNGGRASAIFREACELYGISRVLTQTRAEEVVPVKKVWGDRARFVAIPDYMAADKMTAMTTGFLDSLKWWRDEHGAKMLKFWNAPRLRQFMAEAGATRTQIEDLCEFDGSWRLKIAEAAADLGYMFMVHVADPDTWFKTKYADSETFGTKEEQYRGLESLLNRFPRIPLLAAHMGGYPEDLMFLDGLLTRHPNLYLDTSATKWQVRELSAQPTGVLAAFLGKWSQRVMFGTDVVTSDEHLEPSPDDSPSLFGKLAGSEEEAFELYASRLWAMRTLFESDYDGESPIADPDLAMVDPEKHDETSAPRLRGQSLTRDMLEPLYAGAVGVIDRWYDRN